jgi:hypothetical protein
MTTEQQRTQQMPHSPGATLDPALESRIAEALQPIAESVRRQVADEVQRQLEQSFRHIEPDLLVETRSAPTAAPQGEQPQGDDSSQSGVGTQIAPTQMSGRHPHETQPEEQESPEESKGSSGETDHNQGIGEALSYVAHAAGGLLLDVVKQRGEQHVQSLVNVALDALFSPQIRTLTQRQIEDVVRSLLEETFEAIPTTDPSGETEQKAIGELDLALQEALDSIFDGAVRAQLQQHGERGTEALMRGDVSTATHHAEEAVEAFFTAILKALGRHWSSVLHLLLGLLIGAIEEMAAAKIKEAFALGRLGGDVQKKAEEVQHEVKDKAEDLRDKMESGANTIRDQLQQAEQELEERLKEGVKSGVKQGTSNTQLGRPPSAGRPSGRPRPQSRRAPPGRAPSGRPPSGRPPSKS